MLSWAFSVPMEGSRLSESLVDFDEGADDRCPPVAQVFLLLVAQIVLLHIPQHDGLGENFGLCLFGFGTGSGEQEVKILGSAAFEAEDFLDGGDAADGEISLFFDNTENVARIEPDSHTENTVGVLAVGFLLFLVKILDYISVICIIVNACHNFTPYL